jgi:beta-lactam-binding protein with PASTA domain
MPFPCLTQLMPAGIVMASNPFEGESISAGGTVELYVCAGISLPVPQVIDLPLDIAIRQLGESDFKYAIHSASVAF